MSNKDIPIEWLFKLTSMSDIREECHSPDLPESFRDGLIQATEKISALMIDGDELWKYSSPPESWETKTGSSGLAVKRDEHVVYAIQLITN